MTKTRAARPQARFAFWGKRWRNRADRGRSVAPLSFLPRDTDVGAWALSMSPVPPPPPERKCPCPLTRASLDDDAAL